MRKTAAENTNFRLKAVLDVLAEGVLSGDHRMPATVLAEALVRVPLNAYEAELLSGGIPRGHKSLTTATAKLVKAGWLVKGRSGWTITEDGLRATVAFADAADLLRSARRRNSGSCRHAPSGGRQPPSRLPRRLRPRPRSPEKAPVQGREGCGQGCQADRGRGGSRCQGRAWQESAAETEAAAVASSAEAVAQPEAVAVAGDFNTLLGAPENWAPQYDEAQMELDVLDQLWKISADIPAGYYTFKIALNRSWEENYGAFGAFDGANHELHHDGGQLTIRYDHRTRDITVN